MGNICPLILIVLYWIFITVIIITIQGFIEAHLIMSILWKKIEFYKGKKKQSWSNKNCSWGLGALWASNSRQIFPLWGSFPPTKFFPLIMKILAPLLLPEMRHWSQKKSLKFEHQNELILQGTLEIFLPVAHIFVGICNLWLQKPAAGRTLLVPLPLTRIFRGGVPLPTDQNLKENIDKSREEPWWGFKRQSLNSYWLFNDFKAIKWVTIVLKNYIYGLRSYASSKPTFFFLADTPTPVWA